MGRCGMPKKPYHSDFRFKNRNGIYYVIYKTRPDKPISTGQVTEEDAIAWAYAHQLDKPKVNIKFRDFAESFFVAGECPWTTRMTEKGRVFGAEYLPGNRSRLTCHLLPEFGPLLLSSITTRQIDRWLTGLKGVKAGKALTASTKNKVLDTLRIVFKEAVYEGLIEKNPAESVEPFVDHTTGREPFTVEELQKMFPEDLNEMFLIWGGLQWTAFFYILATTGVRPGEAAALAWGDWIKSLHGAAVSKSIENKTGRRKGLKTETAGVDIKPAVFTKRAEELLLLLEAETPNTDPDELIFKLNELPLKTETILKHFKYSCDRAGVQRGSRTTYCLRHSFNTHLLKQASLKDVQEMMGHTTLQSSRRYNHPRAEDLLSKAQKMRGLISNVYDPKGGGYR
jgi:integrase